jgi:N-acetylglucosaminyldiphosphoundecaprenol N-acetyl-beta-D-mannosaminyltransferase
MLRGLTNSVSLRLPDNQARHNGPERIELMGIGVHKLTMGDVLDRVEDFVAEGSPHRVVTVNLDYISLASRDESFREALNGADLAVADGMPLVWAAGLAQTPLPERVAGLDLVERISEYGSERGWSLFLLGAAPGVAEAAGQVLEERYPGIRIAGSYSPPLGVFTTAEEQRIRDLIRAARPDVLFVALGAPRQDLWIRDNIEHIGVAVAIGVGCAFDVISGGMRRAPRFMQRLGLEWLYRLTREPGRLWKRYLVYDLPAFCRLALSALRTSRAVAGSLPQGSGAGGP